MRPDLSTRRAKTIAIVALPVLLVAAFALASYTALFHVREVRIDGAATLSRDEVLTLAGVGPGTNVFHLDTDAVAASLEADPWVASATVERHLPGTVVIRLRRQDSQTHLVAIFSGEEFLHIASQFVWIWPIRCRILRQGDTSAMHKKSYEKL